MIEVVKAPPLATVQDLGWRTGRAMGLPRGGAMDRALLTEANRMVGNPPGAPALEWALGPGALRFERETVLCVLDDADVTVNGAERQRGALRVEAGAVVRIVPGGRDRFVYVAVGGGIDVPPLLGSRSTYLPGGLGGHEGRRIKTGDRLPLGGTEPVIARPQRGRGDLSEREIASPRLRLAMTSSGMAGALSIRVTRGPQWDRFDAAVRAGFFTGAYTITPASDRMGYRLQGLAVLPREKATLPSEAACPGAVQIPDDGQPIVLMPDGPTVGGYPKLAVVAGADLGRLAQCQPGRTVRFLEA